MAAIRKAYEAKGDKVIGLAPTNAVAQDMGRDGFARATTIHSELFAVKNGRTAWNSRTVLMVDEAAMIDKQYATEPGQQNPYCSQPGTALAFLLVEHFWAGPLFDAIAETGGTLIGEGFLTAEAGLVVGAEVAAMEEAAEVIAQAQAEEASALLAIAAVRAEAAQAIADSQRIQSAAAAAAVRALITAGLVEEAAAHEAVTALTAAGLIVAAADQAAADAVAEDAATVEAADEVAAESVAESLITIAAADEITADATSQAEARLKAASITMAEAQVLRYLPTPLPFSVIAGKLGISRSAAKERAARLYNRLGVHSRDEAVSRARSLGLIRNK